MNFRQKQKETWHDKSCQRWKLSGEWRPRDRKIYYASLVDNELALLTILLEEIYDVVDHIILQEAEMSWRYQKKPKFFTKYKNSHFKRYESKIRHMVYDFDLLANVSKGICPKTSDPNIPKQGMLGDSFGPTNRDTTCPWWQQWYARNNLQTGAHDIGPDDIFIVADLDEIVSREFLVALKHCDVLPEVPADYPLSGKCQKLGVFTFGHKYYFDCSVLKEAGHFHPDLTVGRCLREYGPEELRLHFGDNHPVKPRYYATVKGYPMPPLYKTPPNFLDPKMVGPAGWHLHSFASTAHSMYKFFTRAGKHISSFDQTMLDTVKSKRAQCDERTAFFKFDALACQPLPHAIQENPQSWRHLLQYMEDEELPDEFGSLHQVQDLLSRLKAENGTSQHDKSIFRLMLGGGR